MIENRIELSIIIPAYNSGELLKKCVESIKSSVGVTYEVIIVDDCSTDNTASVCSKFSYQNVKYYCNDKNRGAGACRNRGLSLARGEYIWFVDSDDEICNGADEIIANMKRERLEVAFFDMQISDGRKCYESSYLDDESAMVCSGLDFLIHVLTRGHLSYSCCRQIYKREFIEQKRISFPEDVISEDAVFLFHVCCVANRIYYNNSFLYKYKKRAKSVSSRSNEEFVFAEIKNLKKMIQNVNEQSISHCEAVQLFLQSYVLQVDKRMQNADMDMLKHMFSFCDENELFLYKVFFEKLFLEQYFSEQCIDRIKKASKVFVYGAGEYGRKLIQLLCVYHKVIVGVAITKNNADDSNKSIYGHEIKCIDDIDTIGKDVLAVIATVGTSKYEMERILNEKGCTNYVFID